MKAKISLVAMTGLLGALSTQAANISGSVQASYNRNLGINHDSTNANLGHSYDPQSGTFTLNNAHLAISGSDSASGVGYVVETDFGTDAGATSGAFGIQEAYVTYGFGGTFGLKAGKFATYEGIEVIEGGANPTITRGFLFGMAEAYTHTGAELSYASGMFDVHLGAINGWDLLPDNNSSPSWIAKVGLNMGDPLMLAVSSIIGPEQPLPADDMRMSFDVTGVTKSIPMVDLWLQVNYGMESVGSTDGSWTGFGIQPLVHLTHLFGLGLRYEYFMDDQMTRTGTIFTMPAGVSELTLQNITLTPTFWLATGLMARLEFRMDMASEDVFVDSDNAPTGTQMQIAADVVGSF